MVRAPTDQFVTPGDRVTLSFEVAASESVALDLIVLSELGWRVDAPPERVLVEPAELTRVDLEIEVPTDAAAFALERVTLRLVSEGVDAAGRVELSVREVFDLRLEAPTQAGIGDASLRVTITNAGNSLRSPLVELLLATDERLLATRALTLARGESATVTFDLVLEGAHLLRLRGDRGVEAERSLRVARFGTPPAPPFAVRAHLSAGYDVSAGPFASAQLRGPLSDFSRVDVLVDAPQWRRSYAEVRFETGSVRIGATGAPPFQLDLPREVGVLVSYVSEGVGIAGMVGVTGDDRLAVYGAAAYSAGAHGAAAHGAAAHGAGGVSVAFGGGVREDDPVASLVAGYRDDGTSVALSARYRQERLDARVSGDRRDASAATSLRLELRDGLTSRARIDSEARYRSGPTAVYGLVTTPVGDTAAWDWRAGLTHVLDTEAPGSLDLALQGGLRESFGRVTYRPELPGGWSSTTTAGVRYDSVGFGITLDTQWGWRGAQSVSLDQRTTYYPGAARLDSVTRIRFGLSQDPLGLDLAGAWNRTSRTVGIDAGLSVIDAGWRFDVDAGARYAYGRSSDQWSYSGSISLSYAFDVAVPEGLSTATGGRNVGSLIGIVSVDGAPLADVVASAGRFRAITDSAGRFELRLVPGSYRVTLDATTLPLGIAFTDGATLEVEVVLGETREVTFSGSR